MVERVLRQHTLTMPANRQKLHYENIRAGLAGQTDRIVQENLAETGSEGNISHPQAF
jgi:hypothetical protein